ncbi:hypothetical protein HMPREF1988_01554 [Porphyromonas gingivalis F0185]|nr:hypothetical protein HMPREF1988_01554 [Porphyromonas gingivalis F0185]
MIGVRIDRRLYVFGYLFYYDSERAVPCGIPSLGTALFRYSNLI